MLNITQRGEMICVVDHYERELTSSLTVTLPCIEYVTGKKSIRNESLKALTICR